MWYEVKFEARRGQASVTKKYVVSADHDAGALLRGASLYESPFAGKDDDGPYQEELCALLVTVTPTERPSVAA